MSSENGKESIEEVSEAENTAYISLSQDIIENDVDNIFGIGNNTSETPIVENAQIHLGDDSNFGVENFVDADVDLSESYESDDNEDNEDGLDLHGLKLDRFGFYIGGEDDFHACLEIDPEESARRIKQETHREKKWKEMLENWTFMSKYRPNKIKERIRKGIPDSIRGTVWYKLIRAESYRIKYPNFCHPSKWDLLDERTKDEIERDIDRTFPRHIIFLDKNGAGQQSLRNILRWYAVLDEAVGYCQGMAFIAGLFLSYMPEERAFYSLVGILQNPRAPLRELYLPQMADAKRKLYVFEELGKQHLGELWTYLVEQGMHCSMYVTEWIMTMFCRGFSFDLVSRVMDAFVNEGYKVVYRVALALIKNIEKAIMTSKFEEIMALMRKMPTLVDAPVVMKIAFEIPLTRAQIEYHEKQYAESLARTNKNNRNNDEYHNRR